MGSDAMSKAPTARQYAAAAFKAERHPAIGIESHDGRFYLTDPDGHFLADRAFTTRGEAERARSKALDQGQKQAYRVI
jgi:hypothetical protein